MNTHWRLGLIARPARLLGVVALVVAGCGDDSTSASTTAGPSTSEASGQTTAGPGSTGGGATGSTSGGSSTSTGGQTTSADATSSGTSVETTSSTTAGATEGTGATGEEACECVPGNDLIYVLSDDDEIFTYDPELDSFELLTEVTCPGEQYPFSLAVDRAGLAWIQYLSEEVYTFDPANPAPCEPAGVPGGQAGFGLFGMSFAPESNLDVCDRLFLHSYSGDGPFAEGPGLGELGVFDPMTDEISALGPIDYDGGELAGTGDGRLFAFAGVDPAKLIEYDKDSATPVSTLPLEGLSKTRASAMAFYGGDAYFFTEAVETTCVPCLEFSCPTAYGECQADPLCDEAFHCSIEQGIVEDDCGGLMTQAMLECAAETCVDECYPATINIFSKVTRLDYDDSEGDGQVLTLVNPMAPARIVGAATSTCAPYVPQ